LEDFKHVFTEYGNCFTFNHGENIQGKKKVSVSGTGLRLLFDVNQVLNFLQPRQGSRQTRRYMGLKTSDQDIIVPFQITPTSWVLFQLWSI
jgi:hypothetical protein